MRWTLLEQPLAPLSADAVRIWFADLSALRSAPLALAYEQLLSPEERQRRSRFRFQKDQDLYLVSHSLVRLSLSRVLPGPPEQWRFVEGSHGRPEVVLPPGAPPVRFNLSHTEGLVMCGLTLGHDLGVDVEVINPDRGTLEIAHRFFSPLEVRELHLLAEGDQKTRFFDLWTLKEAYIKAKGAGLSLPLDKFSFQLDRGGIAASFEAPLVERPETWQFELYAPTGGHRAAIAVDHRLPRPPEVEAHWTTPGVSEHPAVSATLARSGASG